MTIADDWGRFVTALVIISTTWAIVATLDIIRRWRGRGK